MHELKPKLLDLFCGAGGAGEGYYRAGFDVTGVDLRPQPHHPKHMHFIQGDAIAYALAEGWRYDAIHASPPCQAHSTITPDKSKHIDLIPATRFVLETLGKPYVIENVAGARRALRNPIMLCGAYFGLKVYRHRLFESNVFIFQPPHQPHGDNTSKGGTYGISDKGFVCVSGRVSGVDYCRAAMGIDWMPRDALVQAIPPTFTEYIGQQLIRYCQETFPASSEAAS